MAAGEGPDANGISLVATPSLPSLSQVKNVQMRGNAQYCGAGGGTDARMNNMMTCHSPGDGDKQAVALVSLIECVSCRLFSLECTDLAHALRTYYSCTSW